MRVWACCFGAIQASGELCRIAVAGLAGAAWHAFRRARRRATDRDHERHVREEREAYVCLDLSLATGLNGSMNAIGARRALAIQVCRVVAQKSVFRRVTMLLRNPEGRLTCAGSVGADDLTVAAVQRWGELASEEECRTRMGLAASSGEKSFAIALGEWSAFDRELSAWAASGKTERRRWRRAIVAPIRTRAGRMVGAIAVCADEQGSELVARWGGFAAAMANIEALASRLADAMKEEGMVEKEELAHPRQSSRDVAHAFEEPADRTAGAPLCRNGTGRRIMRRRTLGEINQG